MFVKRSTLTISDQHGFTLVEMAMVLAILGVLVTMAIGEFIDRRKEAYNRQAMAITRELLTLAATSFANTEMPTFSGALAVGTYPEGYGALQINPQMRCTIFDSGNDVFKFYLTSEAGTTAYYFWLPGPACPTDVDDKGFLSDTIFDNRDLDVQAKDAANWRIAHLGL